MYIFALSLLVVITVFQVIKLDSKWNKILFALASLVLTLMVMFRYGQGPDFWGYRLIFATSPYKRGFPLFWYTWSMHSEIGFKFLLNIFTNFGWSDFVFYGIWSAITMALFLRSFCKYSPYYNVSLLMLFPTCYLTYVYSSVRQGLVAAIFVCCLWKLLEEEKYVKYVIVTLLCASIHGAAILFLILPIVKWIKVKWLLYCIPVATAGGLLIAFTPIHTFLAEISGIVRLANTEISIMGLGERTVMVIIISVLYYLQKEKDSQTEILYKIYLSGYLIILVAMVTAYGSQRVTMPLKAVEIILIPMLLYRCDKKIIKGLVVAAVVGISVVVTLKNLGSYFEEYNAFTYPYRSIFGEKEEYYEEWLDSCRRGADREYDKYE